MTATHSAPEERSSRAPRRAEHAVEHAFECCSLFRTVAPTTRERAIGGANVELVKPDCSVLATDAPASIAIVVRGRVRVEREVSGGKVLPLGYRGANDVLGESILAEPPASCARFVTMEESQVALLPIGLVKELMGTDPLLAEAMIGLVLTRQREAEDRIESMLFRNVEGRLAEFLVKAADRWGVPNPDGTLIAAPITHLEIARSIGSTRETVTLALGALRRQGVLGVVGRRLVLTDRGALVARC